MHRIKTYYFKTGTLILAFYLLILLSFTAMLRRLEQTAMQPDSGKKMVYTLTESDYIDILENNGAFSFNTEKALSDDVYRQQAFQTMRSSLFALSCAFFITIFLLSLALWILLNWFRNRDLLKTANQLENIINTDIISEESELSAVCSKIRQAFQNNLDDYKRLNSYLSHEQKNTLAILRTNMESSGNTECLQIIDKMADGINDILTLSEISAPAPLAAVDVALVCAEVCDNYRNLYEQIQFDFEEDGDTEIEGRQRWVYRAVANLLDNAIKYGNGKPIQVSVRTKKGSVIVRVEDHGIGISPEKQEKIFNHQYRVDTLNKDGYGIGLSLVSHVCSLCQGFVAVESEVGQGSVFYLSFPQKLF